MFTDKAQDIIDQAKDYAFSSGAQQLTLSPILTAVGAQLEAGTLLAECLGLATDKLRSLCPDAPAPSACPGKLPMDDATRAMLAHAKQLAEEVPDTSHPGLIDIRHLVSALASSREATALLNLTPVSQEDAMALLGAWFVRLADAPKLQDLTEQVRGIRADLLARIFGQDHAVHAFVEGLFNAEVVATADTKRRAPKAIFVFAGPPGVGKTFLAEQGATLLKRPFKRFDMSAYSGHQQNEALVGLGKGYHGAHPGQLTEFVEKNPDAVLLFDEIEKAHSKAIHLFLQILDAGTLEDKYNERNVSFRDTVVIFTTNAGRKLYDKPNESGVHSANAAFHRKTILDALATERDPETRQLFFPGAICSRMATGYPVLFNHLRVNELERVVHTELSRVGGLLERQHYKALEFHELLPMALVLREGARADARNLRSQAETFVKTEIFKFCQLYKTERLEEAMEQVDSIRFTIGEERRELEAEVKALFESPDAPRVLLVADSDLSELYSENIEDVEWRTAATPEDALQTLAEEEIDLVLVDLWIGRAMATSVASGTMAHFDHVPAAARGLDVGQELLRKIRERLPQMPVFLLSLAGTVEEGSGAGSVDDELFMACVRAGGARGMVVSRFVDCKADEWEENRDGFAASLCETSRRLYREKAAAKMGAERKVLAFDTAPRVDKRKREITVRLRNLRMTRAIAAADAGEILEDIERPRAKFADVVGARAAKEELQFFIDYLRNPRRFAALGLVPPKGVLLYGPPGTGKTMLARAMAGESDVAFVPTSASSFVTMWQGSGPQSIRDMFDRARRYAPAIIFIDEIDAIGKKRTGSVGTGRAEENTLNALLTEMDGFTSPSPDRPIFLLAATNFKVRPDPNEPHWKRDERLLDEALVRRFSRSIKVDLPEREARAQYLANRLRQHRASEISETTIRSIAERAIGMSIANLESIVETAGRQALKGDGVLRDETIETAFETEVHGEARSKSPEEVRRTACHEAGHAVMYWLWGWWPVYVTIVSRGGHGGYMQRSEEEARSELKTKADLVARVRTSLGGRIAEVVCYGEEEGLSTGAGQDLQNAQKDVADMLEYGMFGATWIGNSERDEGRKKISEILDQELAQTKQLLQENRKHLDAVIDALVTKERVDTSELQSILPEFPRR